MSNNGVYFYFVSDQNYFIIITFALVLIYRITNFILPYFVVLLNKTVLYSKQNAKAELLSNGNDPIRTLEFQIKQDGKSMQTRQALKSEWCFYWKFSSGLHKISLHTVVHKQVEGITVWTKSITNLQNGGKQGTRTRIVATTPANNNTNSNGNGNSSNNRSSNDRTE